MTDGTKSSWGRSRYSREVWTGRGVPLRPSTLTLLKTKMGHFATLFKDKRPNFMTLIHFASINFSNIMELDFLKKKTFIVGIK